MILRDRVTRLRAASVSTGYGNTKRDWANAAGVNYPASVTPQASDENVVDQQRTVARWRLILPATADVVVTDRIFWDGEVHEIDGEVERHKRRGRIHHLEATLIKVKLS